MPTTLDGVIQMLAAAVYTCDRMGRLQFFNEPAVELWGCRPKVGADVWCGSMRMFRPDGTPLPMDECPMAVALREGRAVRGEEIVIERPDGTKRNVLPHAEPFLDANGDVIGTLNILTDVTGQKRSESARPSMTACLDLSDRKRVGDEIHRLAAIVESSDDAIVGKDLDGIVTSWNAGAERIFGYKPGEIIGHSITMLIPADRRDEETDILRRIRRGERIDHYETVRQRKDGSLVDVSLTVSPIKNDAGGIIGASKITRDIGRLKRIEDELRLADQRKNQFLATLAHELRGPLAPLHHALQVLRLSGANASGGAEAVDIMDRQLRQMSRLVDDLLDVARITSGKLILRKERISLAGTLDHALESCQPEIESAGHRLDVDLPPDSVTVEADPVRLAQVFSNLLGNAVRYTRPGGRIRIDAVVESDSVVVRIADNGIGIPPGKLAEIFELFIQIGSPIEKTAGGLGIGLTLARQLVTMHGGTIEARSEGPDMGSEFAVTIPTVAGDDATASGDHSAPAGSNLSRRVLVVDDNVDSAKSLAMIMKILGHETRVAHDGLAAVAAAAKFSPEIILMDIGMPKLNGFDACRRIRSETSGAAPFIIALTGWGQEEDRRRCREAGFDRHLVKPIDAQTLVNALEISARPGGRRDFPGV